MFRISLSLFSSLILVWTLAAQTAPRPVFSIPEEGLQAFFRQQVLISAHRGGPEAPGYPENCIPTFEHLYTRIPAVIELDVVMTLDSILVLLHDNTLDRTTNGSGSIAARNWKDLDTIRLRDPSGTVTPHRIPTFEEVLQWTRLRGAVLTVDVKRGVPFERVVQLINQYGLENRAAVITYNATDALRVYQLNPRILISANMRNLEEVDRILAGGIPAGNLLAFVGTREPLPELYERLQALQIPAILGTMGNLDNMANARGSAVYRELVSRGAGILATDRPTEAYQAIRE